MIRHQLTEATDISLEEAIAGHSADQTICYTEAEGKPIYMGLFFPEDYDAWKKYPVFIMIHGGGWSSHKVFEEQAHWQGDYLGYLARYYAQKGFVAVSLDYCLIKDWGQKPGFGLWEAYKDCMVAIDYLAEHAEAYGLNMEELYLLGESAGGHLAGAVATFEYERAYKFKKVFLLNPITDLLDPMWQKAVPVQAGEEPLAGLDYKQRSEFLSPYYSVKGDVGEVILFHGEEDSTVDPEHSKKFYEKYRAMSCPCELHMFEGTKHAFMLPEYYTDTAACRIGIDIINKKLL